MALKECFPEMSSSVDSQIVFVAFRNYYIFFLTNNYDRKIQNSFLQLPATRNPILATYKNVFKT